MAIRREPRARPHLRTHDGVSEECGRSQHDREEGILEVCRRRASCCHAPSVHEIGHRTHDANACAGRDIAKAGEDKPRHKACMATVSEGFENPLQQRSAIDVRGVREAPHEIRLEGGQRPSGDRPHQPFPAAEVVEDRGVRDAYVRGDLLKPQSVGPCGKEPLLGGIKDGALGLLCRSPAPSGAGLARALRSLA